MVMLGLMKDGGLKNVTIALLVYIVLDCTNLPDTMKKFKPMKERQISPVSGEADEKNN